ncbi:recombinase family protein [Eisenbergiella tayi]|uniref:recombinase family protein n=1 Tax=Eisenbergiella tayi TaxID=1432052 RepID=UPI0009C0808B
MDERHHSRHFIASRVSAIYGKPQDLQTVLQEQKTYYNSLKKQLVFENTHEAIIDADTWERVQELRKTNTA